MSEAKHTPGPWFVKAGLGCKEIGPLLGNHQSIREVCNTVGLEEAEERANAALIAVSPELLDLAADVAEFAGAECEGGFVEWNDYATAKRLQARAAALVARAKGEG